MSNTNLFVCFIYRLLYLLFYGAAVGTHRYLLLEEEEEQDGNGSGAQNDCHEYGILEAVLTLEHAQRMRYVS